MKNVLLASTSEPCMTCCERPTVYMLAYSRYWAYIEAPLNGFHSCAWDELAYQLPGRYIHTKAIQIYNRQASPIVLAKATDMKPQYC